MSFHVDIDDDPPLRGRPKSTKTMKQMECPDCKGAKSPQAKRCAKCAYGGGRTARRHSKEIDVEKLRKILDEYSRKWKLPR